MSRIAAGIGALALLVGFFVAYLDREVLDSDAAANKATAALQEDPGLREALAPAISGPIDEASPVGGPSVDQVADTLDTPGVADAYGAAVGSTVDELTGPDRPKPLVLDLSSVALKAASETVQSATDGLPGAGLIPDQVGDLQVGAVEVDLDGVSWLFDVLAFLDGYESVAYLLIALGLALLAGAVLLAHRPADGLLSAGVSVGVVALLGAAALVVARTLVVGVFDDAATRDAVAASWDALAGSLLTASLVGAGVGLLVAVGSAVTLRARRY